MLYHMGEILQEAAVVQDGCGALELPVCEQALAHDVHAVPSSGAVELPIWLPRPFPFCLSIFRVTLLL